ncbi:MAG: hypothetical protein IPK22_01985 [Verrucomicrobiaceae bacterium]|nr:hypothetical protein [Verrucomicrobiaceae bacterium]
MSALMSLRLLLLLATAGLLASCASSARNSEMDATRRAAIAAEPRGNYFVARRFHIDHTHFWGYVRRPGESWDKSKLVCINERYCKIPDRLPEQPASGPGYGYDHNYEYHFTGEFSGRKIFDPNSNMVLPEFILKSHKLVSQKPGYLFKPNERFNGSQLLRAEAGAVP